MRKMRATAHTIAGLHNARIIMYHCMSSISRFMFLFALLYASSTYMINCTASCPGHNNDKFPESSRNREEFVHEVSVYWRRSVPWYVASLCIGTLRFCALRCLMPLLSPIVHVASCSSKKLLLQLTLHHTHRLPGPCLNYVSTVVTTFLYRL